MLQSDKSEEEEETLYCSQTLQREKKAKLNKIKYLMVCKGDLVAASDLFLQATFFGYTKLKLK